MEQRSSLPSWHTRLRQERIGRNWRQQDLADHLGTTVVTIKRWERGSQRPSAYFRVKLCALFGKSAGELGLVEPVQPLSPVLATAPMQEKVTCSSMDSVDVASVSTPRSVIEPMQASFSSLRSAALPPPAAPVQPKRRRSVALVGVLSLLSLLLLAAIVWGLPGFANVLRATPVPTQLALQKPSASVTPPLGATPTHPPASAATPAPVLTATPTPVLIAIPIPTATPIPTPISVHPTSVELRLSAPGIASTSKSTITIPTGRTVTLTVTPDHSLLPFQTYTMGIYATDPYGFSVLQDCIYPNTATCSYVVALSVSENTDYTKGQHTFHAFLGGTDGTILATSNSITILWS